jgi:Holliday junction resolvase RusA-like endonuclease
MKNVIVSIPYPPSVNKIYHNRVISHDGLTKNHLRGRGLTKEAKDYKRLVAEMIYYSFLGVNFAESLVKLSVIDHPRNRRSDCHNGLKIVCDAIEMSGIIKNDKQLYPFIYPGVLKNPPEWEITLERFDAPFYRMPHDD